MWASEATLLKKNGGPGAKPPGKFLDPANGSGKMLNFKCETLTRNERWNLFKNKYWIWGIYYILYANPMLFQNSLILRQRRIDFHGWTSFKLIFHVWIFSRWSIFHSSKSRIFTIIKLIFIVENFSNMNIFTVKRFSGFNFFTVYMSHGQNIFTDWFSRLKILKSFSRLNIFHGRFFLGTQFPVYI